MPSRTHGVTRNLYQFTKLREQYRDQYISTAQQILDVNSKLGGKQPNSLEKPALSQAYASMFAEPDQLDFMRNNMLTESVDLSPKQQDSTNTQNCSLSLDF